MVGLVYRCDIYRVSIACNDMHLCLCYLVHCSNANSMHIDRSRVFIISVGGHGHFYYRIYRIPTQSRIVVRLTRFGYRGLTLFVLSVYVFPSHGNRDEDGMGRSSGRSPHGGVWLL